MRQIKFRAWHLAEKKMLEVDELNHIASWSFEGMLGVNGVNRSIGIQGGVHNDCVVMQSTGLRDKNGKDIYEGDIIYCALNKAKAVVKYNDKIGQYRFHFFSGGREDLKRQSKYHGTDMTTWFLSTGSEIPITVIGNTYQNPELMDQ